MMLKKGNVRGGILLALFLIILTAVIAAGVCFAGARPVFADETPSVTVTEETTVRDNSWKTEPSITGWAFLKYSGNLAEGEATYGKASYSVLFNDAIKDPVSETLTGFAFVEGKLSTAVVNALKDLAKGDYVLSATVPAGTDTEEVTKTEDGKEVTEEVAFEYAELKKEINFSVERGANGWTENLSLTNTLGTENVWTYGSYSNATHTVSAKSEYGRVEFTVRNNSVVVVDAFVLDKNGDVPETAVKAINTLPVGRYTLRAEVKSTDNYTGLGEFTNGTHQDVNFTITRATNRWIVAPRVNGWDFGSFNNTYIQAKPACGEERMRFTVYGLEKTVVNETVTYRVSGPVSLGGIQNFYLENGEIPRAIVVELNHLERGSYSLVATVAETDSYTGLNVDIDPLNGAIFEVEGTTNTWTSTPNVVQWTWGGFNKNVNVFTAVPDYPFIANDKKVTFGIYYDESLNEPVENLSNFTTVTGTGYNEAVDDDTARLLATLPAGTYYLNARTLGGQSDSYGALNSVIQFTVAKARNYWTKTPQIVQWTWSGYDPAANLISAVPAIGEPENVVFGVYTDANCNRPVAGLMNFSLTKKVDDTVTYSLPGAVASALSELGAGSYYLKAEVAGTDDYSYLGSVSSFTVQKVNNYWLTTPSAQGWRYGSYDTVNNAIYAQPAFGGDAVFKIYHSDGTEVLFNNGDAVVKEFTLEYGKVPGFVTDILPTLGAGKYYVLASVAATDNYTGLNDYTQIEDIAAHGVELNITANTNGWQTVPRVLGWTEGNFDIEKNKIFAEAACGNENLRVTVLDAKGGTVLSCAYTELDYDKLAGLDVGSYTVKLSVEGGNNYEGLSGETTFAVTEDAVGLTGIIAAVVVFGVFDIAAAAFCIYLVVSRRRKIEESFRNMIRKELHRR